MGRLLSTGIADALYARSCHELQPPCGAAGCVDEDLQHAVSHDADAFYCLRFAGADGGLAAAKLSMLPLLLQVASRLEKAASRAGGDARECHPAVRREHRVFRAFNRIRLLPLQTFRLEHQIHPSAIARRPQPFLVFPLQAVGE